LVVNQRWINVLPNSTIWKFCVFKHVFNITFHTSMDFKFQNILNYKCIYSLYQGYNFFLKFEIIF
jgi:hypothetical protein